METSGLDNDGRMETLDCAGGPMETEQSILELANTGPQFRMVTLYQSEIWSQERWKNLGNYLPYKWQGQNCEINSEQSTAT